jgi:hypothetical protein
MSGTRDTTAAGGLLSVSADFTLLYERAAAYVDKEGAPTKRCRRRLKKLSSNPERALLNYAR